MVVNFPLTLLSSGAMRRLRKEIGDAWIRRGAGLDSCPLVNVEPALVFTKLCLFEGAKEVLIPLLYLAKLEI